MIGLGGPRNEEIVLLKGKIHWDRAKTNMWGKACLKFHCISKNKRRQRKQNYNIPNTIKKKIWRTFKPAKIQRERPPIHRMLQGCCATSDRRLNGPVTRNILYWKLAVLVFWILVFKPIISSCLNLQIRIWIYPINVFVLFFFTSTMSFTY